MVADAIVVKLYTNIVVKLIVTCCIVKVDGGSLLINIVHDRRNLICILSCNVGLFPGLLQQ